LYKAVGGGDRGRIFVIYGTFGLTLLAPAIMQTLLRSTMINVRLPSLGVIKVMHATMTGYEMLSIIIALVLFGVAHHILIKTKAGNRVRAVTQNPLLAGFIGIKVRNVYLVTAAVASVTSYIGALLWGEIFSLELGSGMMFTLYGFIVSVMGGLGSISGAILVSLILGMTMSATSFLVGGVYEHIVTTFILMIVLISAPRGIVPTRREV
jgi:branched-subunit amino acid ABC-type transport system permease component